MLQIEYASPLIGQKLSETKEFLQTCGISWDDTCNFTVNVRNESGTLAATGSIDGNILKCIAVLPEYQGAGLAATVVTELIKKAHESRKYHLFLFTKPQNGWIFKELGFYKIISTDDVLWMENEKNGVEKFVNSLECPIKEGIIGCIVANCNPFTNGHLYLTEMAASFCDLVHLFILSEDRSLFSPEVRLNLARQATSHLKNVVVHPTGDYLVSSASFPSYFIKDTARIKEINCALDIAVFAERFVKPLNITHRFIGSEPFSPVTESYNQAMKHFLPAIGVNVVEIPRYIVNGTPVSASMVRKLINEGRLKEVSVLVPDSTYSYLLGEAKI